VPSLQIPQATRNHNAPDPKETSSMVSGRTPTSYMSQGPSSSSRGAAPRKSGQGLSPGGGLRTGGGSMSPRSMGTGRGDPSLGSPRQQRPLAVGDRVCVLPGDATRGVVRYLGSTRMKPGMWVGVELEKPQGKNDGSVNGIRYFDCAMDRGLFVRPDKVVKAEDYQPGRRMSQSSEATQKPQVDAVRLTINVEGINYEKITSDQQSLLACESAVKDAVAHEAGSEVFPQHVTVQLLPNSVMEITVQPPPTTTAARVQAALTNSASLMENIEAALHWARGSQKEPGGSRLTRGLSVSTMEEPWIYGDS